MNENEQHTTEQEVVAAVEEISTEGAAAVKAEKPPLKLNYPQTIKVGFAFAIIMIFWTAYDFVVPLLLENAFGLSNNLRGLIMGLDNLLSLFLLPIFGKLSDRGNGKLVKKLGRRTPYIIIGTIIAVCLMIFVPVSAQKQLERADTLRTEISDIMVYYNDGDSYIDYNGVEHTREQLLGYFYDEAKNGNEKYCSISYLELNNIKTREQFIEFVDLDSTKISGFLGMGGTSYSLDDGKYLKFATVSDKTLVAYEWGEGEKEAAIAAYREANGLNADGSEDANDARLDAFLTMTSSELIDLQNRSDNYSKFVSSGMNVFASAEVEQKETKSPQGTKSLVAYMIILLAVLIAMATFRSPAVALMPDVTPKPLRSQGNAMINLMGGFGGALAFLIYTVVLFQDSLYNYTIIFAGIAGGMLILLACFLAFVKEKQMVKKCEEISAAYGIDVEEDEEKASDTVEEQLPEQQAEEAEEPKTAKEGVKKPRLSLKAFWSSKSKEEKSKLRSFVLILASIFMWFMGYNAISSNLSVYCVKTLNLSAGIASIISGVSMGVSAIAFIPVGFLAVKIGRKKSIMLGFALATVSFILLATPMVIAGAPAVEVLFSLFYLIAGFGLIIANVNTFPMVVELAKAEDVGKYTGYYYTATMSAQAITPFIAGLVMDHITERSLFVYSAICVIIAIVLMFFVKHGDSDILRGKKLDKEEKKRIMLDSMGDAD